MTPHHPPIINQHTRIPQTPHANPLGALVEPNMTPDTILRAGALDRSYLRAVEGYGLGGEEGEQMVRGGVYGGGQGGPEGEARDVGFGEDDEVGGVGGGFADQGEGFGQSRGRVEVDGGDVAGCDGV